MSSSFFRFCFFGPDSGAGSSWRLEFHGRQKTFPGRSFWKLTHTMMSSILCRARSGARVGGLLIRRPMSSGGSVTLPALPYAADSLEPHISGTIMDIHHSKHHATYVAKLNEAMDAAKKATDAGDEARLIELSAAVRCAAPLFGKKKSKSLVVNFINYQFLFL